MSKEASKQPIIDYVFCPHCATKNPRKAYVCLSCFKVMFPKRIRSWWQIPVPSSISITLIFATLVLSALYLGNRWLSSVEANLTLNIKTSEYNVNVTADKRKNEEIKKIKKSIDPKHLNNESSPSPKETP